MDIDERCVGCRLAMICVCVPEPGSDSYFPKKLMHCAITSCGSLAVTFTRSQVEQVIIWVQGDVGSGGWKRVKGAWIPLCVGWKKAGTFGGLLCPKCASDREGYLDFFVS